MWSFFREKATLFVKLFYSVDLQNAAIRTGMRNAVDEKCSGCETLQTRNAAGDGNETKNCIGDGRVEENDHNSLVDRPHCIHSGS